MYINQEEFQHLTVNGEMIKYLRFYKKFRNDDEPLMIAKEGKRIGLCKTQLVLMIQGNKQLESLKKYIDKTPYKSVDDWRASIVKLYGEMPDNGYLYNLIINKMVMSDINSHPSCRGCVKVNDCSLFASLKDPNFCDKRITNDEYINYSNLNSDYRIFLNGIYIELDYLIKLDNRNDIIIGIQGIKNDIRMRLNR